MVLWSLTGVGLRQTLVLDRVEKVRCQGVVRVGMFMVKMGVVSRSLGEIVP